MVLIKYVWSLITQDQVSTVIDEFSFFLMDGNNRVRCFFLPFFRTRAGNGVVVLAYVRVYVYARARAMKFIEVRYF